MAHVICVNAGCTGRVVYRLYELLENNGMGGGREICKPCAVKALRAGKVFNLRFIRSQRLGTAAVYDDFSEAAGDVAAMGHWDGQEWRDDDGGKMNGN